MTDFVRLRAARSPLRRAPGEIQFGVDSTGVILTGLSEAESTWLLSLPTLWRMEQVHALAAELGLRRSRVREMWSTLTRARVVETAPGHRPSPTSALALDLIGAGGPVDLLATNLTRIPGVTLHRASTPPARLHPDQPRLMVLVCRDVFFPPAGEPAIVLPVVLGAGAVTVGPLMSATDVSPCVDCLDHHRAERDGAWPTVVGQMRSRPDPHRVDAEPDLTLLAVAQTVRVVHLILDDVPPPWGVSWHWEADDTAPVTRYWPPHPRCRCGGAGTGGHRSGDPRRLGWV